MVCYCNQGSVHRHFLQNGGIHFASQTYPNSDEKNSYPIHNPRECITRLVCISSNLQACLDLVIWLVYPNSRIQFHLCGHSKNHVAFDFPSSSKFHPRAVWLPTKDVHADFDNWVPPNLVSFFCTFHKLLLRCSTQFVAGHQV